MSKFLFGIFAWCVWWTLFTPVLIKQKFDSWYWRIRERIKYLIRQREIKLYEINCDMSINLYRRGLYETHVLTHQFSVEITNPMTKTDRKISSFFKDTKKMLMYIKAKI